MAKERLDLLEQRATEKGEPLTAESLSKDGEPQTVQDLFKKRKEAKPEAKDTGPKKDPIKEGVEAAGTAMALKPSKAKGGPRPETAQKGDKVTPEMAKEWREIAITPREMEAAETLSREGGDPSKVSVLKPELKEGEQITEQQAQKINEARDQKQMKADLAKQEAEASVKKELEHPDATVTVHEPEAAPAPPFCRSRSRSIPDDFCSAANSENANLLRRSASWVLENHK